MDSNVEAKEFATAISELNIEKVEHFVNVRKRKISCEELFIFIDNGDLENEAFYTILDMLLKVVYDTISIRPLTKQKYSKRLIDSLLVHGAKLKHDTAMTNIDLDILYEIFSRGGGRILARNDYGDTVLHFIVCSDEQTEENLTKIVELYLATGGKIDAQNLWGNSPLLRACTTNCHDYVKILLDRGANVNILDSEKNTLLRRANMFNSPHRDRIFDMSSDATIAKTTILTFRPEEEDFLLKLMIRGANLSNQKNTINFSDFYQRVFHANHLNGPVETDIIPYLSPQRKATLNL